MYDDFEKMLLEQLKDDEFKQEWLSSQVKYDIVKAIITAKKRDNITTKELAIKTDISYDEINELELGDGNPSLELLQKLADGMGMFLKLEFIPKTSYKINDIV